MSAPRVYQHEVGAHESDSAAPRDAEPRIDVSESPTLLGLPANLDVFQWRLYDSPARRGKDTAEENAGLNAARQWDLGASQLVVHEGVSGFEDGELGGPEDTRPQQWR